MTNNRNSSGYVDPTAYEAMQSAQIDRTAASLKTKMVLLANEWGFALTQCGLMHLKTGRRA